MLLRMFLVLIVVVFHGIALGQRPDDKHELEYEQRGPTEGKDQLQLESELRRLIASRDAISQEIQRLCTITGQHQQIIVDIEILELSLTKGRLADVEIEGIDTTWLRSGGFREALAAGVFDDRREAADATLVGSGAETLGFRVLERDDTFACEEK